MPKTRNPMDVLLVLNPEERDFAQRFIGRRLRALDQEQLVKLQTLVNIARQAVRGLQMDREQYPQKPAPCRPAEPDALRSGKSAMNCTERS